jgi:hypothetical protein
MKLKTIIKTPEVYLTEQIGLANSITKVEEGRKNMLFMAITMLTSLVCLIGFTVLYYKSGPSVDLMTIAVTGIIVTGVVLIFSSLAGLISFGTYSSYFLLSFWEKETDIAETMAELGVVLKILFQIMLKAPEVACSVLEQEDIAKQLKRHPALEEKLANCR